MTIPKYTDKQGLLSLGEFNPKLTIPLNSEDNSEETMVRRQQCEDNGVKTTVRRQQCKGRWFVICTGLCHHLRFLLRNLAFLHVNRTPGDLPRPASTCLR